MRFAYLLPLLLTLHHSYAQTASKTTSAIDQVTIFLKGAQVTRSMQYTLTPGNNKVIFSAISPDVEEKSIQVKMEGNVTLLSVSYQPNFIREQQQREEIAALLKQQEDLDNKLAHEKGNLQVYTQEEAMLGKNQDIGGSTNGIKAADLKEVLDLQRQRLAEVLEKQLDIKQRIRLLEEEKLKISKQLAALHNQQQTATSDIILDVLSKTAATGKCTVSYLVKNAGWLPSYDIRVKDISHPLDITFKAKVFQQCGEVWNKVKLQLSTGNPDEGNVRPLLQPWYLRTYSSYDELSRVREIQRTLSSNEIKGRVTDERGSPLPGASIKVKGSTLGTVTDAGGYFDLPSTGREQTLVFSYIGYMSKEIPSSGGFLQVGLQVDERHLDEVVVVGYGVSGEGRLSGAEADTFEKKANVTRKASANTIPDVSEQYTPTTFYYDIPIPYTIEPDGKPYTVGVKELEVPASYEYYAVPKLQKAAFLVAGITDWESLNLLEGEASVFYEDTYLGKSLLDLQSSRDTLLISLGRDNQVSVSRTMEKDYSRKRFLGKNITVARAWNLSVKNNKQAPISITIQDQLPISSNAAMDISGISYGNGQLEESTQMLTWKMVLQPAAEEKQQLKYNVTYPRTAIVNID
ncbi:mucoidy inhibitor MuiA family protein [Chitinophaga agrisoli]|uniref:Mucoidy inhibitor MuiA family protein n=1 Tax=Chitinophaga agrisoli TaxID=2607653 RepID=A0A5B2VYY1_9BACT|nr:DUF4139 domain-containing protein [Chitinophaga agrisoli]KAA2243209.1 mucoidy inhibitor MuiA family protein [Chitinophaga agrisoli]